MATSRVSEILMRMNENVNNVDSLKTCCGVLAILSRDEANKLLIARDGIRQITSVMNTHISNPSLQEAACDLMWSLAFNNNLVKEVIGRQGGIPVIIKGMRLHPGSPDLLKSACGALSNLCQNAQNQALIAAHGGITGILDALKRHKTNSNLLPFIFDALASLIVGNERNGREISETGAIKLILDSIQENGSRADLVKSGCHALAILSDSQGQGAKISEADGVKVLLPTLKLHPNHIDLHRVAAVVLLRMLQESPVAREIAERGGVPLMLSVLKEQNHEVETVAAACHILYSITHPDAVNSTTSGVIPVDIESQLIQNGNTAVDKAIAAQSQSHSNEEDNSSSLSSLSSLSSPSPRPDNNGVNSLNALISVIKQHSNRKDVVRACVRSLVNLSKFRSLLAWVDATENIGPVLAAAAEHTQARDITDSCSLLVKALSKRVPNRPGARLSVLHSFNPSGGIGGNSNDLEMSISGLLCCLKARPNDMELVGAVFATISNTLVSMKTMISSTSSSSNSSRDNAKVKEWEKDSFRVTLVWASMLARELNPSNPSNSSSTNSKSSKLNQSELNSLVVSPTNSKKASSDSKSDSKSNSSNSNSNSNSNNNSNSNSNSNKNSSAKTASGNPNNNNLEENKAKKDWKLKNSSKTNTSFWTTERAVCVFHMARFLKTLVKQYNASSLSIGVVRVRSTSYKSPNNSNNNALDIVAAKDIVTTLFESMPIQNTTSCRDGNVTDPSTGDISTLPTAPPSQMSTNPTSAEDVLGNVWNELDTLLACLIPSIQEAEMNEAASAAAHNSTVKVAQSIAIKPPNHLTPKETGRSPTPTINNNNNNNKTDPDAPSSTFTKSANIISKIDNKISKATTAPSPTASRNRKKSNPSSSSSSSSSSSESKKNRYLNNPDIQHVKGKIMCACNHGNHPSLRAKTRNIPIHPTQDPSNALRQLHQFSPNELEMIHVGRENQNQFNSGGNSDEDQDVPSKMLLCYESCSAAGLSVQSRETLKFPYEVTETTSQLLKNDFPLFEHSLSFDACFESGNLYKVIQRGPTEYDLFLRPDLHSAAMHTQWFYFAVSNTHNKKNIGEGVNGTSRIKFNIVNMLKNDSLFNQGMRPCMYSVQDSQNNNYEPKGWVRCGVPGTISYFQNRFQRNDSIAMASNSMPCYYTLTMTIDFHNADDTYLLAHSYPYTYTDMKLHVNGLLGSPRASRHIRRKLLCKSLAGHDAELLTIADFAATENKDTGAFGVEEQDLISQSVHKRKCIILSARVHPGETGASWMMKGVLDFLTSESEQAALLRSIFVFKIVPMLNPDGVIFGNNRVNLSGVDLNRTWKRPIKTEHPTIFYWKNMIRDLKSIYEVAMFVDLHGHSRKMNTFMYGCDDRRKPRPTVRVFPKLLSWNQYGRKYVSFADCCFAVKKGREGTGRVVVSKELGIHNSYTLEATFCGADFGPLKDVHFNTAHLCESGRALIDTLLDYFLPNPQQREKAANLLKQASERKAARDRSERMAVARQAMQQIRADNALVAANQLLCKEDEVLNEQQNGGTGSGADKKKNEHEHPTGNGSIASNKFSSGKSLGSTKVNGFMIARHKSNGYDSKISASTSASASTTSTATTLMKSSTSNSSLAVENGNGSGSTGNEDMTHHRRASSDGSSLRSNNFDRSNFEKQHRVNGFMSESNNNSSIRSSTQGINRLRVGSANDSGGGASIGSASVASVDKSNNNNLAPASTLVRRENTQHTQLAVLKNKGGSSQSWLLNTLTRDTDKINNERSNRMQHLRNSSTPSPGPPASFALGSGSAVDLGVGGGGGTSPANRNRHHVSVSSRSPRTHISTGGQNAVGERGGGGRSPQIFSENLLPRVGSSGANL